jgi:type IV pilus assembly protein PilW
MTLVELLVALAVGLLVTLLAASTLLASRRGAVAGDAAAQLRDNARFAADLIQRLAAQAGFEDLAVATAPYAGSAAQYAQINQTAIGDLRPNVYGVNNAIPKSTDPLNTATARPASDAGHGSDVLILQYQTVRASIDPSSVSDASDGSMMTCAGNAPPLASIGRDDRVFSVLTVGLSQGEPSLMCMTQSVTSGAISATPLIAGVESFQVLYGVDHVTPNAALRPGQAADSVANSYLRADQLTVAGNQNATYANWRRVRSLRIGMVLRGPERSAQSATLQQLFPLGRQYASSADPGSSYTVTDARLRQTVTFTVHLRNCQNQGYQSGASALACDVTLPQ